MHNLPPVVAATRGRLRQLNHIRRLMYITAELRLATSHRRLSPAQLYSRQMAGAVLGLARLVVGRATTRAGADTATWRATSCIIARSPQHLS